MTLRSGNMQTRGAVVTADVDTYECILVSNHCLGVSTLSTLDYIKFSLQMLAFMGEF